MPRPILILQTQRMGDLILSFPLMLWLKRKYPGRGIWVVAEECIYQELMPISPEVVFVPLIDEAKARLLAESFHLVINLSHREDAAQLAGSLQTREIIGPYYDGQVKRLAGPWQLYRASLTRNNRHNLFHWADLNALDCIDLAEMAATRWEPPRQIDPHKPRVGIFVGASQDEKRPSPAFYSALARELSLRGMSPFLLGGPPDERLCAEVKAGFSGKLANFCGKHRLSGLVKLGQALSLFITPDTGPMHLASWSGVRVLNLSMGPVNPWETGPYQPGQHVLRPSLSCRGCWICRGPNPPCREAFDPRGVASLARQIITGNQTGLARFRQPGLELLCSARNSRGLFELARPGREREPQGRELLSRFWREAFGSLLGLWDKDESTRLAGLLKNAEPKLGRALSLCLLELSREAKLCLSRKRDPDREDFWAAKPPLIRPLAGYLHMLLQNRDFSAKAWESALGSIEFMREITS